MLGADAVIRTLADCGVSVCLGNPGTSEMHLIAALDREPRIRPVLCLFEGVATGAADGFARIAGKPAMTLLHLGPGYLNGGAYLHDARRAFSPVVNVIGDIETLVKPLSRWTDVARTPAEAGPKAAAAYAASFGPPGGNAFLLLPADAAWSEGGEIAAPQALPARPAPASSDIEAAAKALRAAKKPAILLSGDASPTPSPRARRAARDASRRRGCPISASRRLMRWRESTFC
jgi:acetolactate synthase-1/2/3 large subunit